MSEPIQAWECIGCGRIEAPQNCIGICQDRKVEFVYATEHQETLGELQRERAQVSALLPLVRQLAWSKPHADEWEHSFRALQTLARKVLATLPNEGSTLIVPAKRSVHLDP